jgi:hypothetical protein
VDQAKRLKQLETENGRLKKLVADLLLKRQFLQPHHLQEKKMLYKCLGVLMVG